MVLGTRLDPRLGRSSSGEELLMQLQSPTHWWINWSGWETGLPTCKPDSAHANLALIVNAQNGAYLGESKKIAPLHFRNSGMCSLMLLLHIWKERWTRISIETPVLICDGSFSCPVAMWWCAPAKNMKSVDTVSHHLWPPGSTGNSPAPEMPGIHHTYAPLPGANPELRCHVPICLDTHPSGWCPGCGRTCQSSASVMRFFMGPAVPSWSVAPSCLQPSRQDEIRVNRAQGFVPCLHHFSLQLYFSFSIFS